jgi:hypothetical protein
VLDWTILVVYGKCRIKKKRIVSKHDVGNNSLTRQGATRPGDVHRAKMYLDHKQRENERADKSYGTVRFKLSLMKKTL